MKLARMSWFCTLLLVCTVLVGCGPTSTPAIIPAPAATSTPATYADPFVYCAAVGTVDAPGADYVGPQVPKSVAQGLQQALNAPDTPIDFCDSSICPSRRLFCVCSRST